MGSWEGNRGVLEFLGLSRRLPCAVLPIPCIQTPCSRSLPLPPCAGLWASLQFRFLQLQYPGVVIAFEKMLMAGCLPVAAAVQVRLGWVMRRLRRR